MFKYKLKRCIKTARLFVFFNKTLQFNYNNILKINNKNRNIFCFSIILQYYRLYIYES